MDRFSMHKSAIFGLFLMASLLLGTSVNMNMFTSANAQGMGQYDNSYQSTYGNDPYGSSSSYDQSYGYDTQPSYDQKPSYSYSSQSSSSDYSDYKTKDKKYECRTGPFEGFFVSSVEFCDAKKFDDREDHKDRDRDDNKTGQQGPQGPQGPAGPAGPAGANGTQIELFQCPADSNIPGGNVTDERLCFAATPAVQCPSGTTLEGVWVNSTALETCDLDIDIPIVNNTQAQCLKCVDLALLAPPPGQIRPLLFALIGNDTNPATTGIFDICGLDDPRPAFNATVSAVLSPPAEEDVINIFEECVENAPGSDLSISAFSSLASLQDNSLTTTVQSQPEIQSLNTELTDISQQQMQQQQIDNTKQLLASAR